MPASWHAALQLAASSPAPRLAKSIRQAANAGGRSVTSPRWAVTWRMCLQVTLLNTTVSCLTLQRAPPKAKLQLSGRALLLAGVLVPVVMLSSLALVRLAPCLCLCAVVPDVQGCR